MDISAEDFRRHFDLLSDEALLEVNRDELVPMARECLDAELSKRELNADPAAQPPAETDAESEGAEEPSPDREDLVVAATYEDAEEAENARQLLEEAKISSSVVADPEDIEGRQLQLMVPSADLFHALDALGLNLSEEELAAQAEAAGMEDLP